MAHIIVSDPLPESALHLLRQRGHQVHVGPPDDAHLQRAEAWIVRSATRLDGATLARAPRLRAIGRAGVGTDNIDLAAATARGIAVFHAPTGNIHSAAEHAMALLLAAARKIPAADRSMKDARWMRGHLEGTELADKCLLVVGLGRVGRLVVQRARAFGMVVIGHDPFVAPDQAAAWGVEWVELDDGLQRADAVSLHAPLTPQTHGLLDQRRLGLMRKGAIVVNAARGALVDAEALLRALDSGHVRAAGVDVWPEEPPTDWRLARHASVVATPHLGASTEEAQAKAALQACGRVCDYLATGNVGEAVNAQAAVADSTRPWAALTEALAALAAQTLPPGLSSLEVAASPSLDMPALRLHALVGALRAAGEDDVNAISAAARAEGRGWSVSSRPLPDDGPPYVRLALRASAAATSIEGTYTPHYGARVTALDGFALEFRPEGRFLITRHEDVPGVLAAILAVLADAKVNVASLSLARSEPAGRDGRLACAVIQVDGGIPAPAREAVRALPHVRAADRVRVGAPEGQGAAPAPPRASPTAPR